MVVDDYPYHIITRQVVGGIIREKRKGGRNMSNADMVRKALHENGVKQFELAKAALISEFTLSRYLRDDFDDETRGYYLTLIGKIADGRKQKGKKAWKK
jgi:hypothetical protein